MFIYILDTQCKEGYKFSLLNGEIRCVDVNECDPAEDGIFSSYLRSSITFVKCVNSIGSYNYKGKHKKAGCTKM